MDRAERALLAIGVGSSDSDKMLDEDMPDQRERFSLPDVTPLESIDQLRGLMPVAQRCVYLDHAALAPIPQPTADAVNAWVEDSMYSGVLHWKHWQTRIRQVRDLTASLLGCSDCEVAFVANTAAGIAVVAEGFPWRDGDNVVVPGTEFPSNLYPWLNLTSRGVEVRVVSPSSDDVAGDRFLNAIAAACDKNTRVVACSWVDFAGGEQRDLVRLTEIAHAHDALCVVDAIQGLGVLDLDVKAVGVDVLVADSRKWLLSAGGTAVLYIRNEVAERLRVLGPGWNSVVNPTDFASSELKLKSDTTRFETGILNTAGIAALFASLKLLSRISLRDREARLRELRGQLEDVAASAGLTSNRRLPVSRQSGILSLDCGQRDPEAVARELRKQGVVVSVRGGRLRVSPHIYNNDDDIRQFADLCSSV